MDIKVKRRCKVRIMRILFLFLLLLTGCATLSYFPSIDRVYTPTSHVEVLFREPQKDYIIIGKIISEGDIWSHKTLLEKIKKKAMQVGADAILVTEAGHFQGEFGTCQKVEALALKWK